MAIARGIINGTYNGNVTIGSGNTLNVTGSTLTGFPSAGNVNGPASATDGNFPLFDGTTGKLIKNSTSSPSSFAPAVTISTSDPSGTPAIGTLWCKVAT